MFTIKSSGYVGAKKPVAPRGPKVAPALKTYPYAPKDNHAPVAPKVQSVPAKVVPEKIKKAK